VGKPRSKPALLLAAAALLVGAGPGESARAASRRRYSRRRPERPPDRHRPARWGPRPLGPLDHEHDGPLPAPARPVATRSRRGVRGPRGTRARSSGAEHRRARVRAAL